MKKTISIVVLIVLTMVGFGAVITNAAAKPDDKVTICHAAGKVGADKYVTLTISRNAVYGPGGHFNENGTTQAGHEEDYLGPCKTDEPTDPTSQPTDSTSEPTDNPTDPTEPTETVTIPTEPTETVTDPVVTFVDPHWSLKINCLTAPVNWVIPTPSEAYTFTKRATYGRIVEITFTANEGYAFNPSERYTVSDDGHYAVVRVGTPVVRCVVPREPEIGTPQVETHKKKSNKNTEALPNTGA